MGELDEALFRRRGAFVQWRLTAAGRTGILPLMPRFLGGLNFERGPRTLDLDQRPLFTEKRSVQTMPVMGRCIFLSDDRRACRGR